MLPALGLGAFLMPIYNSLIGNTILVVQNLHTKFSVKISDETARSTSLENLRESLDDTRIFITIHLDDVDERYFGFGTIAKRLEDGGESL
jgi:hypothetical protein